MGLVSAVGLEAAKDIIADLDQALRAVSAPVPAPVVTAAPTAGDAVAGPDYNDEGYDTRCTTCGGGAQPDCPLGGCAGGARLIRWVCGKAVRSHLVDGKEVVRPTTIAVVGLSNKEGRPSFRVARKMVRTRSSRPVDACMH